MQHIVILCLRNDQIWLNCLGPLGHSGLHSGRLVIFTCFHFSSGLLFVGHVLLNSFELSKACVYVYLYNDHLLDYHSDKKNAQPLQKIFWNLFCDSQPSLLDKRKKWYTWLWIIISEACVFNLRIPLVIRESGCPFLPLPVCHFFSFFFC